MKNVRWLLFGLHFIPAILANDTAYSFSVKKPMGPPPLLNGSEFIKLSYKQFTTLTRQKPTLWNNLSFNVIKLKLKQDIKKQPNLHFNNIFGSPNMGFRKVLFWILIGVFALIGLFFLIYGFAPR